MDDQALDAFLAIATFDLNLPIREDTTKLYSENPMMTLTCLENAIDKIEMILKQDTFISLERLMRVFEFKATPYCPTIIFDELCDYGYDEEQGVLILSLSCDFPLMPRKVKEKPQGKRRHLKLVENISKQDEESETWQESTPKETSESEESEKT